MGRKTKTESKGKAKRNERVALQRKMDSRLQLVKAAQSVTNPLESLAAFQTFNRQGLDLRLSASPVTTLDEETKTWLMNLIERNIKEMYVKSSWGWNEANKRQEMLDDRACYLIARNASDNAPVAFAHYRYDMDYDDEVLYVYEIQLEDFVRRKGLGRFMMQILELIAFRADMRKIMLTVFKHNLDAVRFFREAMKFETDETSPEDDVYEQFDYEILSKFNKRKLLREEQENRAEAANIITA